MFILCLRTIFARSPGPLRTCSRPREEYIQTILKPNAWGGAIELAILAEHYSTEIASVDVETGRVDRFAPPPARDSGNRAIVIYSGIHYDATSAAPMLDAPDEFHQTIMSRGGAGAGGGEGEEEDEMLAAAKKLADALRAKRAYTNTATFDLRCQVSPTVCYADASCAELTGGRARFAARASKARRRRASTLSRQGTSSSANTERRGLGG